MSTEQNDSQEVSPEERIERFFCNLERCIVTTLKEAYAKGKLAHVELSAEERAFFEQKEGDTVDSANKQAALLRLMGILCHLPTFEILLRCDDNNMLVSVAPYLKTAFTFKLFDSGRTIIDSK